MCALTLWRCALILILLLPCAHCFTFKKKKPSPPLHTAASKKFKSFRAQILEALDLDPATPRSEYESKECQRLGCLYGSIRSGHCFKCVKSLASRLGSSCRMPKRANELLLKQLFVGDFIELVRATPDDLVIDDSSGTVALQNLLGGANYERLKKCQQHHRTTETGDQLADTYIEFQVMIGGYASYDGLTANYLKPARTQPFQLQWGDFWKKRERVSEMGEREADTLPTVGMGAQETNVLLFPENQKGLVKLYDDSSFGFIFGRYKKTLKEIINDLNSAEAASQLYTVSPPLLEPQLEEGARVVPIAPLTILEVTRPGADNSEKGAEAVKVVLQTLKKSTCVFITCRQELRSPYDPNAAWDDAITVAPVFRSLVKDLIETHKPEPAEKAAKWVVQQEHAWRQRFVDQVKNLLNNARILDELEQKRQERVGKLTGLTETCKNAAVKTVEALEKQANRIKAIDLKRVDQARVKKQEDDKLKWFDSHLKETAAQLPEDRLVLLYT